MRSYLKLPTILGNYNNKTE